MPVLKGVDRRLITRLPAFSPVAVRLLSVLADEGASFKDMSSLIALDPVLAGEVLRLANSGLYGRRFEVHSILSAIALLGIGKLSQMVVTVALWRGLQSRTRPFVREWWRHSIAAALVARQTSKEVGVDFAYTAALLHGVGQLALFENDPSGYPNLVGRAYDDGLDLLACEHDPYGADHAALAGMILESWGLPDDLCDAAAKHHDASPSAPLALAVQTACAGAEYAGFGRCGCQELLAEAVPGPVAELLAGDYLLETLVADVNQIECSFA
jgi:HD-like signal output (HDOD) protein